MNWLLRLCLATIIAGCSSDATDSPKMDASNGETGEQQDGATSRGDNGGPDSASRDAESEVGDGASADCTTANERALIWTEVE